ncbi:amino acid ABC transporter permease [Arthrobacter mobilis]|uniref:Amino acid ABC transporter permease n=1 Tax=Arthrobacter mobilis TaxID=2724944 RepID=A0A7X6HE06_9MICC|nr:amino acid ABC transporter permease [Arthrobacter mobilis]NKX55422.1 amino acid ABC transporter permease [Arthrobacter mobilis]
MSILLALLYGIPVTVGVTACSFLIGMVLAAFLALGVRSRHSALGALSRATIDVLRGIPPVVFLFIIFFGIGNQLLRMNPFTAAVIGLGLISAGHLAEIYRGGLSAVHKGQYEASSALGLTGADTMGRIIAPQAFRVALPGMTTYAISLIKDSSIVSTIGVAEIMFIANQSARSGADGLTPFLIAAAIYILLGTPLAWAARSVEAKLHVRISR